MILACHQQLTSKQLILQHMTSPADCFSNYSMTTVAKSSAKKGAEVSQQFWKVVWLWEILGKKFVKGLLHGIGKNWWYCYSLHLLLIWVASIYSNHWLTIGNTSQNIQHRQVEWVLLQFLWISGVQDFSWILPFHSSLAKLVKSLFSPALI